jgi:hypothetical protein
VTTCGAELSQFVFGAALDKQWNVFADRAVLEPDQCSVDGSSDLVGRHVREVHREALNDMADHSCLINRAHVYTVHSASATRQRFGAPAMTSARWARSPLDN